MSNQDQKIAAMRAAGKVLADALLAAKQAAVAGASTMDVDAAARAVVAQHAGMSCAFEGYGGFPGAACVSVNDEVVHTPPRVEKKLKKGDVVSVDFGVGHLGFVTDACTTFVVGGDSAAPPRVRKFLSVVRDALDKGVAAARAGNSVWHIGAAVQDALEQGDAVPIPTLTGHGVGRELHEAPHIPNIRTRGTKNQILRLGQTIAIEPIASLGGSGEIITDADGWTIRTTGSELAAHFEHTLVVGKEGGEVLTG